MVVTKGLVVTKGMMLVTKGVVVIVDRVLRDLPVGTFVAGGSTGSTAIFDLYLGNGGDNGDHAGSTITSTSTSGTATTSGCGLVCGSHRSMQRRKVTHHALVLILLIRVNGLGMLTKVVEARKLLSAMAGKRTFAGVFPDMPSQMLTPAKHHSTFAVAPALKSLCRSGSVTFIYSLTVLLLRQDCSCGHVFV